MMNAQLDPQNPMHALAHVAPEEMLPDAIDHGPGESELHPDDMPQRGGGMCEDAPCCGCCEPHCGWPGDGSGEDDLADLMAVGDEGCCDGPEDFADDCADDCADDFADDAPDSYLEGAYEDRFDTDFYGGE